VKVRACVDAIAGFVEASFASLLLREASRSSKKRGNAATDSHSFCSCSLSLFSFLPCSSLSDLHPPSRHIIPEIA